MEVRSLAEIPEAELVETLCRSQNHRGWLFSPFLTGPEDRHFLRVAFKDLATADSRGGDIDAILLPLGEASNAVAYQIKRVKVVESTFHTLMPGKLGEFRKAVQQANATLSLGFSWVVLFILVVTDGRSRVDFNFVSRGPTWEVVDQIHRALDLTDLHEDIGLAKIEVAQPVDRDFTLAAGIGGRFLRPPVRRDQSPPLTAMLRRYAAARAGC